MIVRALTASVLLAGCVSTICWAESAFHFDLPATAVAVDITPADAAVTERLVSIQFNLSLIADALPSPQAEQIVVQVCPLGGAATVADYAPRTELSSQYTGDIAESRSREATDHVGLSLEAAYGHLVQGNLGADRGEKNLNSTKYTRVAPLHVVAASGTTHRGRGVYFKLRADDRQVLEGDKQFTVVLSVPAHWRGELIEFRVEAESMTKSFSSSLSSFAGKDPKSRVIGASRFLVATHLSGDLEMARLARQLGECESQMRQTALQATNKPTSRTSHVSFRFDLTTADTGVSHERIARSLEQVTFGQVDPYIDPTIRQLSVPTRVAILDYLEVRKNFQLALK